MRNNKTNNINLGVIIMSESTYTVKGSRVTGNGWSYNLTSKVDAVKLCQTLNTYHATYTRSKKIEHKIDRITKTLIQLQLTNGIMTEELRKLHKEIQ